MAPAPPCLREKWHTWRPRGGPSVPERRPQKRWPGIFGRKKKWAGEGLHGFLNSNGWRVTCIFQTTYHLSHFRGGGGREKSGPDSSFFLVGATDFPFLNLRRVSRSLLVAAALRRIGAEEAQARLWFANVCGTGWGRGHNYRRLFWFCLDIFICAPMLEDPATPQTF